MRRPDADVCADTCTDRGRATQAVGADACAAGLFAPGCCERRFIERRADDEEAFEAHARTCDSNAIVDTLTQMADEAEESRT